MPELLPSWEDTEESERQAAEHIRSRRSGSAKTGAAPSGCGAYGSLGSGFVGGGNIGVGYESSNGGRGDNQQYAIDKCGHHTPNWISWISR